MTVEVEMVLSETDLLTRSLGKVMASHKRLSGAFPRQALQRFSIELLRITCTAIVAVLLLTQPILAAQISQTNPADGRSAIVLTGDILAGDADRFIRYIDEYFVKKNRLLTAVYLDSNGGLVDEGSKIAALVHRIDVAAVVGDSAVCHSICFLILAASTQRIIGTRAALGVHSTAVDSNQIGGKSAEDTLSMAETIKLARIYWKYGVPDSVVAAMVATLPDSLYTLNEHEKELLRTGARH